MSLKPSIKVAIKNKLDKLKKEIDTRIIINHCSSTSNIFCKVWFSTIVHHQRTSMFEYLQSCGFQEKKI